MSPSSPAPTFTVEQLKRTALIAMFSDDELLQRLVFKGGNAIDLVYQVGGRASLDLDFSIPDSPTDPEVEEMNQRIQQSIEKTFLLAGLAAFDYKFLPKPPLLSPDLQSFWGGFQIEFKVLPKDTFELASSPESRSRSALTISGQKRKISIDISRSEYCVDKMDADIDGHLIYVYTPQMMLCEKLRAICQQLVEYAGVIPNPSRSPRAKDFYDIHLLSTCYGIRFQTPSDRELLKNVFLAKRVPLDFLTLVSSSREFHRVDFDSVISTLPRSDTPQSYDYYFDFVLQLIKELETLGIV